MCMPISGSIELKDGAVTNQLPNCYKFLLKLIKLTFVGLNHTIPN